MKTTLVTFLLMITTISVFSQDTVYQNTATTLLANSDRLSIRGYSEITFNQRFDKDVRYNGKMDLKRLVMFTGFKFNKTTSFISELEVEHGNEIYVEQAFVNHRINRFINLRAGLLLIPMGIVNEYHEPTTFNGVERPNMDRYLLPSTWREIGAGIQGIIPQASLAYQLYVVNGFKSHNGEKGLVNEINGFRSGRQKGIKSVFTHPNVTSKIDYVGIRNLKLGASVYAGKTQSSLFDGLSKDSTHLVAQADSSVINMAMFGLDGRYRFKRFRVRGQMVWAKLGNTSAYNGLTGSKLSNEMFGYFVETSYNVLRSSSKYQLFPFVRYENYNTQGSASEALNDKDSERNEITAGLSFFLHSGAVLKADYQNIKQGNTTKQQVNLGVGIWF